MEVLDNAMLLKSSSCKHTHIGKSDELSINSSFLQSKVCFRREKQRPRLRSLIIKVGNYGFEEKGHLGYYDYNHVSKVSPFCGEKKKSGKKKEGWSDVSTKKKMKLLKGLVKDLSTFSDLGFGLKFDENNEGFVGVDDEKSMGISQAAEILLAQLKQLRAEEESMMREKDCESSSSSSESSDSECDEVVDMKCVKNKAVVQPIESTKIQSVNEEPSMSVPSTLTQNLEQKSCNMILEMTLNKDAGIEVLDSGDSSLNQLKVGSIEKKIEVCMGGKCKKLGAPALMEEFQRVVGDEGVVVGCKCMGKCRSAPNVRVVNGIAGDNNVGDDNSLRTPGKSLCIGVGLEDVEMIVANYLGEELNEQSHVAVAIATAAVPA